MREFPILETERLTLRQITEQDADFLLKHFGNREVVKFFGMPPMTERDEALSFIDNFQKGFENNGAMRWAITLKDSGDMIGTAGYHNSLNPYKRCELGYDLSPFYWRQGIMTEALSPIIDYLFNTQDMIRIGATIVNHNGASSRVVEKLGFKQEGLLRDYIIQEETVFDAFMYSLLQKEWQDLK